MENSSVSNQISQLDLESQSKPTGFFVDEHQMKKQDPKYILIHPSIHQKKELVKGDINWMKSSYERLLLEIYSGGVSIDW